MLLAVEALDLDEGFDLAIESLEKKEALAVLLPGLGTPSSKTV